MTWSLRRSSSSRSTSCPGERVRSLLSLVLRWDSRLVRKRRRFFGVPLFLLAAIAVHERRTVLRSAGFALAGFVLVGAFGYVLNVVHTGRVLGDPYALGPLRQPNLSFIGTASTAARLGYNFVDLSGYPVPKGATEPFETAAKALFRVAGIPVNPPESTVLEPPVPSAFSFTVNTHSDEIVSYFGPLGALLLLPLSAGFLVAALAGRAPPLFLVPSLAIPSFILGIALFSRYNEFNGRYLLPAAVVAMSLVSWLYRHRSLAAMAIAVGVLTLFLTHIENRWKPTGEDGRTPIWSLTRPQAQSTNWPRMVGVIEAVEKHVPAHGRLGYALSYNDWIYPFYGPNLTRRLVKVPREGLFEAAERNRLDAIIITRKVPRVMPGLEGNPVSRHDLRVSRSKDRLDPTS